MVLVSALCLSWRKKGLLRPQTGAEVAFTDITVDRDNQPILEFAGDFADAGKVGTGALTNEETIFCEQLTIFPSVFGGHRHPLINDGLVKNVGSNVGRLL